MTDYLERALPHGRRDRFEQHVRLCPGCDAYLAQMRQTIAMLGELPRRSPTPHRRDRLVAAFRAWHRD